MEKTATRKMGSRKLGNRKIQQRKMTPQVKGKRKVIWCPEEMATVVQASETNGNRKIGIYLCHAVTRMMQLQAYVIRVRLKTTDNQRHILISDNFVLPFFPTMSIFVAEFSYCPIFRQPFLLLPFFLLPFFPLPLFHTLILCCPVFLPSHFSLPIFPIAQFSGSHFFRCHFFSCRFCRESAKHLHVARQMLKFWN